MPQGSAVTLTNGTTWNLNGQTVDLGSTGTVTLDGGSIINGTLAAGQFNLLNGTISANLSARSISPATAMFR